MTLTLYETNANFLLGAVTYNREQAWTLTPSGSASNVGGGASGSATSNIICWVGPSGQTIHSSATWPTTGWTNGQAVVGNSSTSITCVFTHRRVSNDGNTLRTGTDQAGSIVGTGTVTFTGEYTNANAGTVAANDYYLQTVEGVNSSMSSTTVLVETNTVNSQYVLPVDAGSAAASSVAPANQFRLVAVRRAAIF